MIRIFPHEVSAERVMETVRVEGPETWMTQKRYFTMGEYYREESAAALWRASSKQPTRTQFATPLGPDSANATTCLRWWSALAMFCAWLTSVQTRSSGTWYGCCRLSGSCTHHHGEGGSEFAQYR